MKNCPNCGAPLEPYECKCKYCGTWYFDFTAFDMSEDVPYYVKFRTPYGVLTTLARPELKTIDQGTDDIDCIGGFNNNMLYKFTRSHWCDLNVVFHSQLDPEKGILYQIEMEE